MPIYKFGVGKGGQKILIEKFIKIKNSEKVSNGSSSINNKYSTYTKFSSN